LSDELTRLLASRLAGQQSSTGFAGRFARVAETYEERFGGLGDTLARIAAKNHHTGLGNPLARLRQGSLGGVLQHDLGTEPGERRAAPAY
jgi:acetyl-CoA acetyltransferase